ncbi:MAG: FAD-binding protein, partial [Gammaproteobacteria bacterium]|nr:FAD-binding protein [Gammaproteobacteria bacterium]
MKTEELAKLFSQVLPDQCLVSNEAALRTFECDGLSAFRELPGLVVLPDNIGHVMAALKVCRENAIPVVGRGAGTGLSGGALPHPEGIVLSLSRMNKLLEVDTENRIARVEPGMTNLKISKEVEHLGLYYAPDPSSQIACSIGGNIAENSGGVHCLKYGLTVHNVIAVKVATIEGDLIDMGHQSLDSPGFNLLSLMVGSEGMMGIVVEATVKLLPIPECARVVMAIFDSVQKAGDSVASVIASGIIPAGIEMMDNPAIRAAEAFVNAGYPVDAKAILLCELDGTDEEVDHQIQQVTQLFQDSGANEVRVAKDEYERQLFWATVALAPGRDERQKPARR